MRNAVTASEGAGGLTWLPALPAESEADAGRGASEPPRPPRLDQDFVTGALPTPLGPAPQVPAALNRRDRWGSLKARWGVGRMVYTVDPGLYALGEPDRDAPVLLSATTR